MISLLELGVIAGWEATRHHAAVDKNPQRKRIGNLEMGWIDLRHSTSRRDYLRDRVSRRAAGETSLETRTRLYLILLVGQ